ncbi:uncharacterized protein LOC106464855 [Limulus polyphemus]|uniref:Uncharacterized protein LOC106464855 n=1 Tax=Limulus polyphemus TaxID=6850 RepID=A0ABM1BEP7_LIMPO|nr:uncharacterized protein LOC106464855 [Limulus polyphemus]
MNSSAILFIFLTVALLSESLPTNNLQLIGKCTTQELFSMNQKMQRCYMHDGSPTNFQIQLMSNVTNRDYASLCKFLEEATQCSVSVYETFDCLTEDIKNFQRVGYRATKASLSFMCGNNQANIAKFIEGGGIDCIGKISATEDSSCFVEIASLVKEQGVQKIFKSWDFTCGLMEKAVGCLSSMLSSCTQDVSDMFNGVVLSYLKETPCSSTDNSLQYFKYQHEDGTELGQFDFVGLN